MDFSCQVQVQISLFWDLIDWGQMTFSGKRKIDISNLQGLAGSSVINKITRHLSHDTDHHHLIGGLLYVLNYAPGVGADLPVAFYLDKSHFDKVTIEVPAFEVEVGLSFDLSSSSNPEDLSFDKRYVIGSRAATWDLQEKTTQ